MIESRILLDNVRSVHNVGSIFRTAECAGVKKIYCIGTTPVPIDRFGRKRKDFAKVSLGAEDLVGWEHLEDGEAIAAIKKLKKEGFEIVAVEQTKESIGISDFKRMPKTLYILGNEVEGISRSLL
jgi:tRNA G18 (ribose-2'-O)-methylase SpoU